MGVLDDFLTEKYGRPTRAIDNPLVDPGTVGTTAVQFLTRNANRIGWTIINLSANSVYLAFEGDVSSSRGVLLDPSGGTAHSWIEEDGEMTQKEVFLVASGANSAVFVEEVEVM